MTARLARGVTGFRDKNAQLPETDMAAWRKFLGRDHSEVVVSDVLFNFWD